MKITSAFRADDSFELRIEAHGHTQVVGIASQLIEVREVRKLLEMLGHELGLAAFRLTAAETESVLAAAGMQKTVVTGEGGNA